jgi:hypothetical protein
MEQQPLDWFGDPLPVPHKPAQNPNPCIALYGVDPQGRQCRDCIHLRYRPLRSGKKYWKCDKRRMTEGASSDHRKYWDACGRYERRTEEYHGG